jgi:membrane protease YdiL (CAAX protease family)
MLQRLHAVFQNSFFTAIVLLVILILTLSTAVSAVLYLPTSIGEQPHKLHIDEMYYFPSLTLNTFNYLDISYNDGGFLVPAYNNVGTVKGVAIISDGVYQFYPPDSSYREQGDISEIYIPYQEEQLALLLLEAQFTEITSRNQVIDANNQLIEYQESDQYFDQIRAQAQSIFDKESDVYISIQLFGYKRVYIPDSEVTIALLKTPSLQYLLYNENRTISLHDLSTNEEYFNVTNPNEAVEYPPKNILIYASITISLLLIAAIIVVWLLTIDLDQKKRFERLKKQIEYPHWLVILTILIYFIGQLLLSSYSVFDYQNIILTVLLYLLIILSFCKNSAERQYIGLNFYHWGHSISSAIALGFFFQILGAFNIPIRFNFDSYLNLISMILVAFFAQALINELIFRGIIQNYIERLTNTIVAITATAGIVAVINFIVNTYIYQLVTIEALIQSFLVAPFGSIVLSLLYIRTRSILASSLLATLLIILPKILIF